MFARDIDVILAGTKPNVEYLIDVDGSDGKWIRQIIQLLEWLRDYVKRVFIKTFFCA